MDELAHQAKLDPLEFRLKEFKGRSSARRLRGRPQRNRLAPSEKISRPRVRHRRRRGKRRFTSPRGAEVAVDRATGAVRVVRVVSSFECGAIVNPDGLRNQVEGSNIMGLGGALFEAIGFEDGRILNAAFFKIPRPTFQRCSCN